MKYQSCLLLNSVNLEKGGLALVRLKGVDSRQAEQYKFPYHYVASEGRFPNFCWSWSYGPSYLAAIRIIKLWLGRNIEQGTQRYIDVGCGDAKLLSDIGPEVKPIEFFGVDYNSEAISLAEKFSYSDAKFFNVDLQELGRTEPKFDAATLIEVLEHIPLNECDIFIKQLARILRVEGELFLTVPSSNVPVTEKHYRHFDFDTVRDAMSNEFRLVEIFGFEKETLMTKVLRKCLSNRF